MADSGAQNFYYQLIVARTVAVGVVFWNRDKKCGVGRPGTRWDRQLYRCRIQCRLALVENLWWRPMFSSRGLGAVPETMLVHKVAVRQGLCLETDVVWLRIMMTIIIYCQILTRYADASSVCRARWPARGDACAGRGCGGRPSQQPTRPRQSLAATAQTSDRASICAV